MVRGAFWTIRTYWRCEGSLEAALPHRSCSPARFASRTEKHAIASKLRLGAYLRRMNWENAVGFGCTVGIPRASITSEAGFPGRPLKDYQRLVKENNGNWRASLNDIESGIMLPSED